MFGTVLKSKKKTYKLIFGLNSLIEIEQLSNSIENIFDDLSEGLNLELIRTLCYYGLNKEYSFEEVGNIIDELLETMTITELCSKIQEAIFSSLGFKETNSEVNSEKQ